MINFPMGNESSLLDEIQKYLARNPTNQTVPTAAQNTPMPQQNAPVVSRSALPSGLSYLQRALALTQEQPDMASLQEYARNRQAQGQQSMLNALAAGIAGPQYQGLQQSYLRRAMAAQEPEQIGPGMAYGGKYISDPYAGKKEQANILAETGKELFRAESEAAKAEAADKRLEMMYSPERLTPGERQQSARRVMQYGEKADSARQTISLIPTMERALQDAPQGYFGPLIAKTASIASGLGISKADKLTAADQLADAISKQFGIAKLSDIGGNDTDRELITAISTTYNGQNLKEVNKELLKVLKQAADRGIDAFNEAQRWSVKNKSVLRPNEEGLTLDEYLKNKYENINASVTPTQNMDYGAPPAGAVRRK